MKQLIVLVDALGWITVERMGFLSDLLPYRKCLTTVFGYSSTAIPSLLTGAMPEDHGHWFLYKRALGKSPFVGASLVDRAPGNLGTRWRVRVRLQEFWRKRAGIQGYFSLYEVPMRVLGDLAPVEVEDTWAPGAFPETPTLVDYLTEQNLSFFQSDWREPDAEKIAKARRSIQNENPDVVLLYLTEVDATQHRVGTTHEEFDAKVRDVEKEVRQLIDDMGGSGSVGVSLFSDHGMTDITGHHDLLAILKEAGLERGRDFEGFLDSTVARFWSMKDRSAIEKVLDSISWGKRLSDAQIKEWGVRFPDQDYGEVFFLVDPGLLILPSDMGSAPLAAMHGYDPADPTSDACFLADRDLGLESDHIISVLPALKRRIEGGF